MITEHDKNRFLGYIAKRLMQEYGLEKAQALALIDAYDFKGMLDEMPEEAMHRSVGYWSESIYKSKRTALVRD